MVKKPDMEKVKGKLQEKLKRREKTPEEIHLDNCRKQASIVSKMESKVANLKNKIIKTDRDKITAKDQYERKVKQLETDKVDYQNEIGLVSDQVTQEKRKYDQMNCPKL